ncbi:YozQ family protein [Metabacillus herbersteinensis]|uniref:YozQ family protein n=1 Tax=Metabacillus herbersteinensis TaxID=283816 RepID=A0ABV6GB01_9BACI
MKKEPLDSTQIAGRQYEVEDYKREDELSSGLAVTHEQVSDDYMAGTIDVKLNNEKDEKNSIPRKE